MSGARGPLSPKGRGRAYGLSAAATGLAERQQTTLNTAPVHDPLRLSPTDFALFFPPPSWGRVREGVAGMPAYRNDSQRLHARAQRAAMTPTEAALWAALRNHRFMGLPIRRKAPIGPWIADFVIPSRRIAIVIQPETHQSGIDHPPAGALERLGYMVLRPSAAELAPQALPAFLRHLAARVTS